MDHTTKSTHRHAFARWVRHLWLDQDDARRQLSRAGLRRLEERVRASESRHSGELRLCVEGGLPWRALWQGQTARTRALEMFSSLRVWDTEQNNGVLIYLLLADHRIEILGDRGITRLIDQTTWGRIAEQLAQQLRRGEFEAGLNQAVETVTQLLAEHFPLAEGQRNLNELPDQVVLV